MIYASIAQTCQDLDDYINALEYFKFELQKIGDEQVNYESSCKSLINIAYIKEKLKYDFDEIRSVYEAAFEKARAANNYALQVHELIFSLI